MKTSSPALIAHLNNSTQFLMADLYTLTLANGATFRYTSSDVRIDWQGNSYYATSLISRGKTRCIVGLEVDTLDITIVSAPALLINGVTFAAAAVRGDLDGASLRLDRVFLSDWMVAPIGALLLFEGAVSNVYGDRLDVKITVKSMLERFNTIMPRRVYQAACANALFDHSCGLVKTSYGWSGGGTILAGSTALRLVTSNTNMPVTWSELGTIDFTSGQNSGQKRTVKRSNLGVFELVGKLPYTPAVGDAFVAYPGCDKTLSTCQAKFNNVVKFRGQPYIPRPESAL